MHSDTLGGQELRLEVLETFTYKLSSSVGGELSEVLQGLGTGHFL